MGAWGGIDIAVAGCGPAGLAAALLLRRDGHRVTLFDRFEAPRPIGSSLMIQPTGLAVLERMGLADAAIQNGARIDRPTGQAGPRGSIVLDVHYAALGRKAAFGIGIHRARIVVDFGASGVGTIRAMRATGTPLQTPRRSGVAAPHRLKGLVAAVQAGESKSRG
ncbi:MAG: FAD-dependent monooxygenase [Sphingomonas sp.]|nr:FAD-dependent monooxygenase [Sphingomonas sp.]MDX3885054.1 FAD-dependent monooxygenase [Sphingomonas sp.]